MFTAQTSTQGQWDVPFIGVCVYQPGFTLHIQHCTHPVLYHTVHTDSVAYIMPGAIQGDSECAAVQRTSKLSHHNKRDEM